MLLDTIDNRPDHATETEARRLASELKRGLYRREFTIEYQPLVNLRSGAVLGVEALLRWPGRASGASMPDTFIHAAGRSDAINALGEWVLSQACAEARYWPGRRLAVNVSAGQVSSGALLGQVDRALMQSGLSPSRLELEFSEVTPLDLGLETLRTLWALRDRGIGLTLDDFGAGNSPLSMLRLLPLSAVKIDGRMIQDLPHSRDAADSLRALVRAAQAMQLVVVAEGIETMAQRELLLDLGCDEGQGFLFSRPMPPERISNALDYGNDTCSPDRSTPELSDERYFPH